MIEIGRVPLLRKGIEGFPAIQNDKSVAVASINASLAEYDNDVLSAAKDCDSNLSGGDKQASVGEENWTRTVTVTMRGPHYISYLAKDSYFCGGAHPDAGTFALVFDLRTGKLVDWAKVFAAATIQMQTNGDGSVVQTVASVSLTKLYLSKVLPSLDKDCADAIRNEDFASGFSLWPQAEAESLVVHPNLSHAIAACGADVSLTVEEQRSLGVSEEMIAAIQAAHAGQDTSK